MAMDPRNGEVLALGSLPELRPQRVRQAALAGDVTTRSTRRRTARRCSTARSPPPIRPARRSSRSPRWRRSRRASITPTQTIIDDGKFKIGPQTFQNAGGASYGALQPVAARSRSPPTSSSTRSASAPTRSGPIIQQWAQAARARPPHRDRPPRRVRRPGARPRVARRGLRQVPEVRQARAGARPRRSRRCSKCGGIERPWSTGDNVNLAVGQGDLQADAAADGRRLLGDRQRRHGRAPAPRRMSVEDGHGARRPGDPHRRRAPRASSTRLPTRRSSTACTARPPSRGGTSADVFKGFPHAATVYGKTGTAERAGTARPVLVRLLRARPSAPDRRRRHRREGRLRRRDRRARRAPDPVASGSTSATDKFDAGQLGHAMSASLHRSSPPPSRRAPLVPRECRLRLDPLLLLATLGLVACSLIALKGATADDVPGQPVLLRRAPGASTPASGSC